MDIVVAVRDRRHRKNENLNEDVGKIYVKDNIRSIKKLLESEKTVLVKENTFVKEKTSKYIKEYKGDITNHALCVINKIVIAAAEKYHLTFPLREIFIMAEPGVASHIITQIKDKARLFTVVSAFDAIGKMYDELYFKYGTVIRHIPFFNNTDWENSLAVKLEGTDDKKEWIKCPVISFDDAIINDKTLIIRDVHIDSLKTKPVNDALSINGGIESFCVLGHMPDGDCIVSLNKKSGKIYTL